MLLIPQRLTSRIVNATTYLVKDEDFINSKQPEVLEFKNKLNLFLNKYDPAADEKSLEETITIYFDTTKPYLHSGEDKSETQEKKFIMELKKKYHLKEVSTNFDIYREANSVWDINENTAEKLLLFTIDNLITIPQQYAVNATNASQYLLKDEVLLTNQQPEVVEFKHKLSLITYDNNDQSLINMKRIYGPMDSFANITDYYFELPVDKITPESKFIIDLLMKYNCINVSMRFIKHLETFLQSFIKMFEEGRKDLEKPLLDWFEKFITLTELPKKMEAISKFIELV